MKIKFKANYQDFAEMYYHSLKTQGKTTDNFYRNLIVSLCIGGISCVPAFMFAGNKWVGGLTFFIVFCISLFSHRTPGEKDYSLEYRKLLGNKPCEVEITLSDNGIRSKYLGNEWLLSWENLKDIQETNEKLIFSFNYDNFLWIPLKAFESPAQTGKFIAFAKSNIPTPKSITT